MLTICLALGSWKYVDNRIKYDTFLFANGSAQEGFQPGTRERYGERYDFTTFGLRELIALTYPTRPTAVSRICRWIGASGRRCTGSCGAT